MTSTGPDAMGSLPDGQPDAAHVRIPIIRIVALLTIFTVFMLELAFFIIRATRYNMYGGTDLLGVPLCGIGFLLDAYVVIAALVLRHKRKRGNTASKGWQPHVGVLLFCDIIVGIGCLAWGVLAGVLGIISGTGLFICYAVAVVCVGILHTKLMVDDCKDIHYARRERRRNREFERQRQTV